MTRPWTASPARSSQTRAAPNRKKAGTADAAPAPFQELRSTSGGRRHHFVLGAYAAAAARPLLAFRLGATECRRKPVRLDPVRLGNGFGRLLGIATASARASAGRAGLNLGRLCRDIIGSGGRDRFGLFHCGTIDLCLGDWRTLAAGRALQARTRVTLWAIFAAGAILARSTLLARSTFLALGALFSLRTVLTLRTIFPLRAIFTLRALAVLAVELELFALVVRREVASLALGLFDPSLVVVEDAEIVIGELEIIFRIYAIALHLRIASKVPVLLQQLRGIATCATVDAIAVIGTARVTPALRTLPTTTATAADLPVVYQRVCVPFKTVRRSCRSRMLPVARPRPCATPSAMATGPQWRA
jgi:hypothetical protein